MTDRPRTPEDVEILLHQVGAAWRNAQVFGDVDVVPRQAHPNRGTHRRWLDRVAAIAIAGVAFSVLALALPQLGVKVPASPTAGSSGAATPVPSATPAPSATDEMVLPDASLSPAAAEAVRLAVIKAVQADQQNFGGVYLEDGVLVIQYIGENLGRPAIDRILRSQVAVRWEQVRWPRAELERVARDIAGRYLGEVPGVYAVSAGSKENRVKVMVDKDSVDEVAALLAAYGEIVVVVPGEPIIAH